MRRRPRGQTIRRGGSLRGEGDQFDAQHGAHVGIDAVLDRQAIVLHPPDQSGFVSLGRQPIGADLCQLLCPCLRRQSGGVIRMRFVPVKTAEQQAASMILRTREMLIKQRSQTANALRAHMAELGITAGTGMASIAKLLVLLRDEKDNRIPGAARFALILFAEQIELLTTRIEKLDREILVAVRKDPDARRLMSIPGVGPLIAATVRTSVVDARDFATARDFAAWTGLTPRAQSSGGKERLGAISKRGNRQLRTLLIVGATSIIKLAKRGLKVPLWIRTMLQRRPVKVVSVALANKIARTIWALLVRGGNYQAPAAMLKS
jgi:transposase